MGRPKANTSKQSATEKIERAFWEILEKEGYENLSILRLSQETTLNRNSIYYHYKNLEDIAHKAIDHPIDDDTVLYFISVLIARQFDALLSPDMSDKRKKIHLLAKSDAPFLKTSLKNHLLKTWFSYFHIDSNKLSDLDNLTLDFITSGLITLLGNESFLTDPSAFPSTEIGKATLHTLQQLSR